MGGKENLSIAEQWLAEFEKNLRDNIEHSNASFDISNSIAGKAQIVHKVMFEKATSQLFMFLRGFRKEIFDNQDVIDAFCTSYEKYKENNKVKIFNFGFAKNEGEYKLFKFGNGDGSNTYKESSEFEIVTLKKMSNFLIENDITYVKLIEFNCEGAEYEIIEDLFENNKLNIFDAIQIQFHKIDNYQQLYNNSFSLLSRNFNKIWGFDFIWECWKTNKK